jgi:hypothetical protein
MHSRIRKYGIAILFLAIIVLVLGFTSISLITSSTVSKSYVFTQGIILDSGCNKTYVQFKDTTGKTIVVDYSSFLLEPFKTCTLAPLKGSVVAVAYNPSNPALNPVVNAETARTQGYIYGGIGVSLAILTLFLTWRSIRLPGMY